MKYNRFEDLPVWQASIEFALRVFEFTSSAETQFRGLGDTKSQLERAALSVSNNIAEGFERGTNAELINFLYIERGSAGESRSMLCLREKLARFNEFNSEIGILKSRAENVSRQFHGWIESLKNSEIKGEKFLTDKERNRLRQIREDKEFREALQKVMRGEKVDWDQI
jgi:four helix bundle protein